jgi:hypothetical protein
MLLYLWTVLYGKVYDICGAQDLNDLILIIVSGVTGSWRLQRGSWC